MRRASRLNLRMVMHGPLSASGGMMALTRLPSLRRASTRGARLVDAPADGGDDPLDDPEHRLVGGEDLVGQGDLALLLHVDLVGVVHHDLADVLVGEERLQRAQAQRLVEHVGEQLVPVHVLRELAVGLHLVDDVADRLLGAAPQLLVAESIHVQPAEVEVLDQPVVDVLLQPRVALDARVDLVLVLLRERRLQ